MSEHRCLILEVMSRNAGFHHDAPQRQEGAVLSAYHVVGIITGRAKLAAPAAEPTTVPDSAAVTGAG